MRHVVGTKTRHMATDAAFGGRLVGLEKLTTVAVNASVAVVTLRISDRIMRVVACPTPHLSLARLGASTEGKQFRVAHGLHFRHCSPFLSFQDIHGPRVLQDHARLKVSHAEPGTRHSHLPGHMALLAHAGSSPRREPCGIYDRPGRRLRHVLVPWTVAAVTGNRLQRDSRIVIAVASSSHRSQTSGVTLQAFHFHWPGEVSIRIIVVSGGHRPPTACRVEGNRGLEQVSPNACQIAAAGSSRPHEGRDVVLDGSRAADHPVAHAGLRLVDLETARRDVVYDESFWMACGPAHRASHAGSRVSFYFLRMAAGTRMLAKRRESDYQSQQNQPCHGPTLLPCLT